MFSMNEVYEAYTFIVRNGSLNIFIIATNVFINFMHLHFDKKKIDLKKFFFNNQVHDISTEFLNHLFFVS